MSSGVDWSDTHFRDSWSYHLTKELCECIELSTKMEWDEIGVGPWMLCDFVKVCLGMDIYNNNLKYFSTRKKFTVS